ncbi:MAG: hypothetical protein ACFCVG_00835 [Kineosporiaceae bacterium]
MADPSVLAGEGGAEGLQVTTLDGLEPLHGVVASVEDRGEVAAEPSGGFGESGDVGEDAPSAC